MTLAELRAEVRARGFDYLSDSRLNRFINRSYNDLCEAAEWPFLEATLTAQATPLTISDLRTIEQVLDSSTKTPIGAIDRRSLRELSDDITTAGSPDYYYLTSRTTINLYPTGHTIDVRYYKAPADLSADGDSPIIPARWHSTIVDGAVAYCYDDSDNFPAAQFCRANIDRDLAFMRRSYLEPAVDEGSFVIPDGSFL